MPNLSPSKSWDGPMASRWTEAQKEFAYKVVNDIAEDVDCFESREELRMALNIYADLLWDANVELRDMKDRKLLADYDAVLERIERIKSA